MSLESELVALLGSMCDKVYPEIAPHGTPSPYVTYQDLGGRPLRWLDNSAADKRHTLLQVNAWAASYLEAKALIQAIEDAMCACTAFTATPQEESYPVREEDTELYGRIQRFSVYSTR